MSQIVRFRGQRMDVVLDVRSKLEFWLGHLDGAVNVPVDLVADRFGDDDLLPRDARILVYCASGARSAMAAGTLRALGFTRVVDGGGMGETARACVVAAG